MGDCVRSRPCCLGSVNGVGSRAGVCTGLRAESKADVGGGRRHGVQELCMAGTILALSAAPEIAAPGDKEARQDEGEN